MANRINFGIDFKTNDNSLKAIKTELQEIQRLTVQDLTFRNKDLSLSQAKSQLIEIKEEAKSVQEALDRSFSPQLGSINVSKFQQELKKLNLDKIYNEFSNIGPAGTKAFNQIGSSVLSANLQLKESSKLLDTMALSMKNTIKWGITSKVFDGVTSSIQKAWDYVKVLDTSLNDIRIVTDKSAESMDQFAKKANRAAQALGASTKDYTKGALIYYQQGLTDEETQARTETTLKAANVTGQTGEEVSEQLTAVWNGYKVTAQETELYVDKLAAVAADSAADLEELSTGMSKVASAAASAGVDFDQLNATLATVVSVTREAPETVGTAFKTIYARLGDLALNGEDEFGVTLGNVSGKMEELGIQILDEQGNMRGMGDIIEDTAAKWDTWSQAQRQAAAVAMAGKMQYSRLIALFDNWDMYTKELETSTNAMGTLQHQQDIYMESTQAHLEQLSTSWERVFDSFIDNEGINEIIDVFTGLTNGVANWVEAIGGGGDALLTLGSIATRVFSKQIAQGINTTIKNFESAKFNAKQLENQLEQLKEIRDASAIKNNQGQYVDKSGKVLANQEDESSRVYQDKAAEARYQERLKMQDYIKSLSSEDIMEVNQIIDDYANALSDKQQYEQRMEEVANIIKTTLQRELNPEEIQNYLTGGEDTTGYEEESLNKQLSFREAKEKALSLESTMAKSDEQETIENEQLYYEDWKKDIEDVLSSLQKLRQEQSLSKETRQKATLAAESFEDIEFDTKDKAKASEEKIKSRIQNVVKVFDSAYTDIEKNNQDITKVINDNVSGVVDNLDRNIENTKNGVNEIHDSMNRLSNTESIVKLTSGISGLAAAWQSLSNLGDIWNNEDLTTGEKLLQIVMSLTTGFGMLASSLKDIKDADIKKTFGNITEKIGGKILETDAGKKLGTSMKSLVAKEATEEGTKALAKMGTQAAVTSGAMGEVGAAASASGAATVGAGTMGIAALGAIAAAAVVAGVAIYAIYMKATEAQREIDNLRESAKRLGEEAARSQERINSIETSFSSYETALETLKSCVKGSEEWNEALLKVNQTVLEILEQYPELAKIDGIIKNDSTTGALSLDSEKYNAFIKARIEGIQRLQQASIYTNALANQKQNKLDTKKAQDKADTSLQNQLYMSRDYATQEQIKNRRENGLRPAELSKGNIDNYSLDIKTLMGLGQKEYQAKVKDFTDKLVAAGDLTKSQAEQYQESMKKQYSSIQELGNEADQCAIELENAANTIAAIDLGSDSSAVERQIYAEKYKTEYEKEQKKVKKEIEKGLSITDRSDKDEYNKLLKEYNKATGNNYTAGSGNVVRGFDGKNGIYFKTGAEDEGKEGTKFERDDIINVIAGYRAQQKASSSKTGEQAQKFNQTLRDALGITEQDADNILSKNFEKGMLNEETYNKVKEQQDKIKSLFTSEEWKKMGYDSGSEFSANLAQALGDKFSETDRQEYLKNQFKNVLDNASATAAKEYDIDEDVFKGYGQYIADIADESDKLADSLKEDADSTAIVTQSIMRMNKGIEELAENMEDWNSILKKSDKTSQEYYEALTGVRKGLANILDTEEEFIDADFITSHLDDITKASEGNADAIDRLRNAYADDIIIDIAADLKVSDDIKNKMVNTVNQLQTEIPNIEIGAVANESFISSCQDLINTAGMTVEDANKMFSALGFEAEYESQPQETTQTVPTYATFKKVLEDGEGKKGAKKGEFYKAEESYTVQTGTQTYKGSSEAFSLAVSTNDGKNIKKPKISKLTKKGTGSFNNYSSSNKGGAASPKSGGSSKKEPDRIDPVEKEKDRYHDVNIELKQIETQLGRLQKQKDKLFGAALIDNLNKQLKVLDKQIDTTNQKISIARGELSELRGKLSGQGVSFNADGTIGNYASAYQSQLNYVNGIINNYNSMSAEAQEKYKDTVENAKENFDKFVENISRYDELISDEIPGLEDEIQDAINEKIEIQIEEFDMEIEIRLNLAEAERDWNEFKKKVIDGIKDDDILGNTAARLADFSSYYKDNENGIVQASSRHLEDTLAQLRQMDEKGWSDVYGDNRTAALEDLQKYYEQLMEDLTSVEELQEEIHESYMDMMDEAQEKFDEQVKAFEMVTNLIEHDMNVISLVNGEEAYGPLAKYYEKQEQNNLKQLDFQRQQVDFWKVQMDAAEEGSNRWEAAKEKWMDAVDAWNSAVEESIENLQDKYLNAINLIFQNLNNKVTGGMGLDYVGEEWDLINQNADQYLDTINSLYETQALEDKYLDALDKTDSIAAQRQLKKLMDEELADLRERDKLTQYDIDRANMKYEIALKQIALQEAQQNKTSMRLRRDSQGNYTYQYTADDSEVANAQQELNNLYNSLYNFDKENYTENLNQLYDIWAEFQEKMAEAAQINDPTARAERELLLQEQYGELINGIVEQNEQIRTNLYDSAFLDLANLYEVDVSNFQTMTDEEKEILMGDLLPYWTSGVQQMADVFAGEDGFLGVCRNAFEEITEATKDYEDSLDSLEDAANTDFEEIRDGVDETIDQTLELIDDNDELINKYEDQLNAIGQVINQLDTLIAKYSAAKNEAIAATEAAYKYWQFEQQRAAEAAAKNSGSGSGGSNSSNGAGGSGSGGSGGGAGSGDGNLAVGDIATYTGRYYSDSWGGGNSGSRYAGVARGIVVDKVNGNPYGVHIHSADGRYGDLGWIKKSQLSGYDTGGYTGSWGNESGKLALLHQKELVLNENDTSNILNAVKILRDVTDIIGSSVLSRIAAISANSSMNGSGFGDTLEQNVHIDASFPSVTDSHEIQDAIDNLLNVATQRINRR